MPFSRRSSQPRDPTWISWGSYISRRILHHWATWAADDELNWHHGFTGGSVVKNLPAKQETPYWSLGWEDPLEKEKATHSSILVWKIPWRGAWKTVRLKVKSLSRVQLFATLRTVTCHTLPSMARILEWVAISFSRGSSQLRDQTWVSLHCRQMLLTSEPPPEKSLNTSSSIIS